MQAFLDRLTRALSFFFLVFALLPAPWFFGAWEMWWFWPFAALVFLSAVFFALRFLVHAVALLRRMEEEDLETAWAGAGWILAGLFGAFLLYAIVRGATTPVIMDAERSVLLFLTSFLVAFEIVFGFDERQRRLLAVLLMANFLGLALYGIINHFLFKSERVLWMPGFEQYRLEQRATGSYYCPNHFAGVMELAFAMALGFLTIRGLPWRRRLLPLIVAPIAVFAVVLSKSCGGGVTILVTCLAALVWGLGQWRPAVRWAWRVAAAVMIVITTWATVKCAPGYLNRFKGYLAWEELRAGPLRETVRVLWRQVEASSRGQMVAGAIRAWRSSPFFGIGPGMHQHLWPHFAASADGDREKGIWPRYINNEFHSYEVHCDWMQLLEEYGIFGFLLFTAFAVAVVRTLFLSVRTNALEWEMSGWENPNSSNPGPVLGALFAIVAVGVHSIFDFNLQMPATAWLFTAVVALGVPEATQR